MNTNNHGLYVSSFGICELNRLNLLAAYTVKQCNLRRVYFCCMLLRTTIKCIICRYSAPLYCFVFFSAWKRSCIAVVACVRPFAELPILAALMYCRVAQCSMVKNKVCATDQDTLWFFSFYQCILPLFQCILALNYNWKIMLTSDLDCIMVRLHKVLLQKSDRGRNQHL